MDVHIRVLTIGTMAKRAGVSTPTIRYYEDIGLLPPAGRSPSGQRTYEESNLPRIVFIKRCRDFGFSIEQVRVLVGLSISPDKDCREVGNIARSHLNEVQAKLAQLRELERSLETFVTNCDAVCSGGRGRDCVIFRELAAPAPRDKCCA